MIVDRSYVTENEAQRERLRALVARLSDAELDRPLPAGWTIAGVLGHLAFWDQRILVLLERWEQQGASAVPRALNYADVDDWINDAAKPLLLALRLAHQVLADPVNMTAVAGGREPGAHQVGLILLVFKQGDTHFSRFAHIDNGRSVHPY